MTYKADRFKRSAFLNILGLERARKVYDSFLDRVYFI